ncbi:family 43 glycosylhydrolase [Melghirimyces profundicolus]|uniref:family 43 glycosylhydrolase n=1 Tax=Melghirimyces profundicolus TaxID=1242148 RepID=UPI001472C48A
MNEGPQILKRNGKVFIVYSASGSWTPDYCLGMLTLKDGADPMVPGSWSKSKHPVFQRNDRAGVFGPGHASFTKSPDGTEDWIVYHATSGENDGWNNRKARTQPFTWNRDGTPDFGAPVSTDTVLDVPSGTKGSRGK